MADRIHAFAPVWRGGERVLVLGTCPSVESLKQEFYYAHPRNAFWRILSDAAGAPPPVSVAEKKALLGALGVALWDVVASCERSGSLDSAIAEPLPNDIGGLLARVPTIKRVLLNGHAADVLLKRLCPGAVGALPARVMPSTSPAYTLPYEAKQKIWIPALTGTGEEPCNSSI